MANTFNDYVARLPGYTDTLLSSEPTRVLVGSLRKVAKRGIYLFTFRGRHLYVGRSDRIPQRLRMHTRPSSTDSQATFAFLMARRRSHATPPTYRKAGSRRQLLQDPEFRKTFERCKQQLRRMDIRTIEVRDPIMQALLEIYLSVTLRTPYNKFETS